MELKLCPFCGGESKYSDEHVAVFCTQCFVETGDNDTKEEAVKAWNTRVKIKSVSE